MVEVETASGQPRAIEVQYPSDVGAARQAARAAAQALGFEPQAVEEITLAASELASNLLKHAQAGKLVVAPISARGRGGLQLESLDNGPGIRNIQRALVDGFSTAGSLGVGLGAVNRLMDELEFGSSPNGHGTRIVCRKWRRGPAQSLPCPLAIGVASRPRPGCDQNGDAFVVCHWTESVLVGIVDGLGHGQLAHQAAETARHYVEHHFDLPLVQLFAGVGRACHGTRGVVMALVRFDWGRGKLSFASIGDIEARVFPRSARLTLPARRGILGLNAPRALAIEHPWAEHNLLVLHSDGLRTHWSEEDFPDLPRWPAGEAAQQLLRGLGRQEDDATVIVVREKTP